MTDRASRHLESMITPAGRRDLEGGPPAPRGTPPSRSLSNDISAMQNGASAADPRPSPRSRALAVDAQFAHLGLQGGALHPELGGGAFGAADAAIGFGEGAENGFALGGGQRDGFTRGAGRASRPAWGLSVRGWERREWSRGRR